MTCLYLSFESFLSSILIQVKSSGNLEFNDQAKILLGAYLPGVDLITEPNRTPDILVEHEQSGDNRFIQEEKRIQIYDNWGKEFPLDFYHLLYSVLRNELLRRNLFSIHAACVGKDDYILIVGHTGVGKTSIVLELLKNKNIRFFSGNKTVVAFKNGGLEAIAGTSTLTASVDDMKHHLDDEANIIKYGNRAAITFNKRFTDDPGSVRAVVLASLNDGVSENNILNPISALHRLYVYFLDTVNADTIVCGGHGVYVGTPPLGTQEKLARNLKEVLSKIPAYSIKGSIDFVCDSITKI